MAIIRVEVVRLDAHPGDVWDLDLQVDVPGELMLSDFLSTVLEPFLERGPGATWRCRGRTKEQWHDMAQVVTTGPTERRGARLLVADEPLRAFIGPDQASLQVGCRPT